MMPPNPTATIHDALARGRAFARDAERQADVVAASLRFEGWLVEQGMPRFMAVEHADAYREAGLCVMRERGKP